MRQEKKHELLKPETSFFIHFFSSFFFFLLPCKDDVELALMPLRIFYFLKCIMNHPIALPRALEKPNVKNFQSECKARRKTRKTKQNKTKNYKTGWLSPLVCSSDVIMKNESLVAEETVGQIGGQSGSNIGSRKT